MRQMEKLTFPNVSPKRFALIQAHAKSQGLSLDSASGRTNWDHGIGVQYAYDENKEVLHITAAVPFGMTDNEVEGAISAIVRRSQPDYPQDEAHGVPPLTRDERLARNAMQKESQAPPLLDPKIPATTVVDERGAPVPA